MQFRRGIERVLPVLSIVVVLVTILFLLSPFVALLGSGMSRDVLGRLAQPEILDALRLSLITSVVATVCVVVLGLPVSYVLATKTFVGKRALNVLVTLPMVLPPTVAGFALLMAFGRAGMVGSVFQPWGITLPFTTLGVIVGQVFMSLPFFVGPVRSGFMAVDRDVLDVAATLRASEVYRFFRVLLPLAAPSVFAGCVMAWARALGEFGATITFAGNLPGVTQTLPLAVYSALQSDLQAAITLSLILIASSLVVLTVLYFSPTSAPWNRPHADR